MYGWSISRLPTSPDEFASPSGPPERRSRRARADAVSGDDHDVRLLPVLVPVAVDVDRARGEAVPVRRDLADAGAGHELGAVLERARPHGRVRRALRPLRAAPHAGSRPLAGGEAPDGLRADGVRCRPPVPSELVHPLGGLAPDRPDRKRRLRGRGARRVVRVARHAGDLHLLVDPLVEGLHLLVGDRPVVCEPVQAAQPELLRAQADPLGAEVDRAPADRVEHDRRDRRVGDLERVVRRVLPNVRIGAPLLVGDELPLELVAREIGRVLPAALLEADDAEAGFGQMAGGHRASCARADDEDVGPVAVSREPHRQRRRRLRGENAGRRRLADRGRARSPGRVARRGGRTRPRPETEAACPGPG